MPEVSFIERSRSFGGPKYTGVYDASGPVFVLRQRCEGLQIGRDRDFHRIGPSLAQTPPDGVAEPDIEGVGAVEDVALASAGARVDRFAEGRHGDKILTDPGQNQMFQDALAWVGRAH